MKLRATLLAVALLAAMSIAADKKKIEQVSVDKLLEETQKSAEPTEGFNLVWWLPHEYWQATLLQNKDLTAKERDEFLKTLEPYFLVVVVRADISAMGAFKFHKREDVLKNMTVTYVNKDGKKMELAPVADPDEEVNTVMEVTKPILKAAIGKMGESMYFFLYKDRHSDGKRLASPSEKGKLVVELKKTPKEAGGVVAFDCPLNSLMVPRHCATCKKDMHITWNFCPWCGKKLPE